MPLASDDAPKSHLGCRERLSHCYGLFALSAMMFDAGDDAEIVRMMRDCVPPLTSCHVEFVYLIANGRPLSPPDTERVDPELTELVTGLGPEGGSIVFGDGLWRWAFPLKTLRMVLGYLVVRCEAKPPDDAWLLLQLLGQQAAAALANVSLRRQERDHVAELRRVNDALSTTVERLERQTAMHKALTRVSASGEGEAGIARAVHELTGLAVVIEDEFGNIRAVSGLDGSRHHPKPGDQARQTLMHKAITHCGPMRDHDRIVSLVRPRNDVLGVLALIDPGHTAGPYEMFVAEYATTVLSLELAHERSLAEVEIHVHRDLVDDLIAGTDDEGAFARAAAVGHDLHAPHHVLVVRWQHPGTAEAVGVAAQRVLRGWRRHTLLSRHGGEVVLLVNGHVDGKALYEALAGQLGTPTGTIGVGGRCERPGEFPRSYSEARQSLSIRTESATPHGATAFDDLGVYRILGNPGSRADVENFMREWLGPLLAYDTRRRSELVRTLFEYLECGGNYDNAAAALVIHRSTLRYRLTRIRDIAGVDLTNVDTRLNLQVATRAWQLLHAHGPGSRRRHTHLEHWR
jgi:sugar diacid utilization regulator